MNPLLLLGGSGLVAYLLLRHKDAAAATLASAPQPIQAMQPVIWQSPTPQAPPAVPSVPVAIVVQAPKPSAPTSPNSRSPQVATSAPQYSGEVAPHPQSATVVRLKGRWGWPVPRWQGRAPVISDGFGSPRGAMAHMGVDLMFARIASDPFPNGPNGSKHFVMPDAWMAVAASDGMLWSAGHTPRGFAVVLDHGNVATFYQHLDTLMVPETKPPTKGTPRERLIQIKAGQPLGVIGGRSAGSGPPQAPPLRAMARRPGERDRSAAGHETWQVFTPNDIAPFLPALTRNAAKKRPAKRPEFVPVRAHERRWPGTALHPPR